MIFLGAGASACFGIPTTPGLTKQIVRVLTKSDPTLLKAIRVFAKDNNIDFHFENILTAMTALSSPAEVDRNHWSHIFAARFPNQIGDYTEIIEKMYNMICDSCTAPFSQGKEKYLDAQKLESIFKITFDPLIGVPLSRERPELVFSTNYDPSIELWCQKRFLKCNDGTKDTNNLECREVLGSERFLKQLQPEKEGSFFEVDLVRLHGSVWVYQRSNPESLLKFSVPRDRLLFPDLYEGILKQKPVLIFPGQEEKLRRAQWDPMYQFFKDQMKGYCLFIGYSFRHAVINEPIVDNLENERITKLGIMAPNPHKNLGDLLSQEEIQGYIGRGQIVMMPAEFGKDSAIKHLVQWFTHTLGINFTNQPSLLKAATGWKESRVKRYAG